MTSEVESSNGEDVRATDTGPDVRSDSPTTDPLTEPRVGKVAWGLVGWGVAAIALGFLARTPVVANQFYKDLWWFFLLVGVGILAWALLFRRPG